MSSGRIVDLIVVISKDIPGVALQKNSGYEPMIEDKILMMTRNNSNVLSTPLSDIEMTLSMHLLLELYIIFIFDKEPCTIIQWRDLNTYNALDYRITS
jgi:hypothetical protein